MRKLLFIMLLLLVSNFSKAEDYAFLISAGYASDDDEPLNSEYWYDLFLAYEDLIVNQGYTHNNIFVFYGDGSDFVSDYPRYKKELHTTWTDDIVDYPVSEESLDEIFGMKSDVISNEDNVLIRWVVGHGVDTWDSYKAKIEKVGDDEEIPEQTLYDIINQVDEYRSRTILWMTCFSGSIVVGDKTIDDDEIPYNNGKTVVVTSSAHNQESFSKYFGDDNLPHAQFNYYVTSAFSGKYPDGEEVDADANNDNEVSIQEMFDYSSVLQKSEFDVILPQLSDDNSRASITYIKENLSLSGANISDNLSYEVGSIVASDYTITGNGADVNFVGGDYYDESTIKLLPGFTVNNGAKFRAYRGKIESTTSLLKSSEDELTNTNSETQDIELKYSIEEMDFNEMQTVSTIAVYPNPTSGQLNIKVDNVNDLIQLSICNISGHIILATQISELETTLDISEVQEGVYFIKLQKNNEVITKQIIKE